MWKKSINFVHSNEYTGIEGDGGNERQILGGEKVSSEMAPVQKLTATAVDGNETYAYYRIPGWQQSSPAIVFLHGGLMQYRQDQLRKTVRENPVVTRLLAQGYAVVAATFRTYKQDPLTRGVIDDSAAVLKEVKKLPGVDHERIIVMGGSGGGHIALNLARSEDYAATIVGEPATILTAEMLKNGDYELRVKIMKNFAKYYKPENQKIFSDKISQIKTPILIFHGDVHPFKNMNIPYLMPLLEEHGIDHELKVYHGMKHGFYLGHQAPEHVIKEVVRDIQSFLKDRISCLPEPNNRLA